MPNISIRIPFDDRLRGKIIRSKKSYAWLKDLKVGDIVVIHQHYHSGHPDSLDRVKCFDKVRIVLERSYVQYTRLKGETLGTKSRNTPRLIEPTETLINRIRTHEQRTKFNNFILDFDFDRLSLKEITEVYNILLNHVGVDDEGL